MIIRFIGLLIFIFLVSIDILLFVPRLTIKTIKIVFVYIVYGVDIADEFFISIAPSALWFLNKYNA